MAQYTSKFVNIDPDNCPLEELKKVLDELHSLEGYYETKQLAIKQFINSIYGATASKYFIGYNIDVAESITLQGQDLNHYSENCVNRYYRGIFQSQEEFNKVIHVPVVSYSEKYQIPLDTPLYKKGDNGWEETPSPIPIERINEGHLNSDEKKALSKFTVQTTFGLYLGHPYEKIAAIKIGAGRVTDQKPLDHPTLIKDFAYLDKVSYLEGDISESLTIAGDTDSIYVEFGRITNQLGITDISKATRFVVDMWNYGCGPYMERCYEEYAKKYNCDKNLQSLELEKIADTAIMLAKKHYAMSECFIEPDIYVKPGEHVLYKGIELIQRSTPPYVRKCLDEFMRYVLEWYAHHNDRPPFDEIHKMLDRYKKEFKMQSPDDICKSAIIGDYDKFVLDDKNQLILGEHVPIHVQAAAISNFILNQEKNKKYKVKYHTIKSRDRVKFYYTNNSIYKVFGFLPGQYPFEIATNVGINYDLQFEKLVLEPINSVLEILNYNKMNSTLDYTESLW